MKFALCVWQQVFPFGVTAEAMFTFDIFEKIKMTFVYFGNYFDLLRLLIE